MLESYQTAVGVLPDHGNGSKVSSNGSTSTTILNRLEHRRQTALRVTEPSPFCSLRIVIGLNAPQRGQLGATMKTVGTSIHDSMAIGSVLLVVGR